LNAIQEAAQRTRRERTDAMYLEVDNASPELYEAVVNIASTTPNLELEQRAALERRIMGLVLRALTDAHSGISSNG
jgi:DNA-dependent RNA polymerase auxiliary subunit epsilon